MSRQFWQQLDAANVSVPTPKRPVATKAPSTNSTIRIKITESCNQPATQNNSIESKSSKAPNNITPVGSKPSSFLNSRTSSVVENSAPAKTPAVPKQPAIHQIDFNNFLSKFEAFLRANLLFTDELAKKLAEIKGMNPKSGLSVLSATLENHQHKVPKANPEKRKPAGSIIDRQKEIKVISGGQVEEKETFNVDIIYDSPIPLCLPDNMEYKNGKCSLIPGKTRTKLVANPDALEILRNISGPVCVLSIVGPCRTGKSYILNQILRCGTQGGKIFSLGHTMNPETMGIWMWGKPFPVTLASGETATLILLDSEGLAAVQAETQHDNQIYALTALLSSYMIYNSVGRPVADDLDKLHFIVNLVKSIKVKNEQHSPAELSNEFPDFLWLFRDCVLQPCIGNQPCSITEYLTGVIFKIQQDFNAFADPINDKRNLIRKCILECFPSISGYTLPPPTDDATILQNIEKPEYAASLSKQFLSGVAVLRKKILANMLPKKVRNQYVVGDMFATLVSHYVDVLNNPGACPVIQSAWELAVSSAIASAMRKAQDLYAKVLSEKFTPNVFPLESDAFDAIHHHAQSLAQSLFLDSISLHSEDEIMRHIPLLLDSFAKYEKENLSGGMLLPYYQKNLDASSALCESTFASLWTKHVQSLLQNVNENTDLSFLESEIAKIQMTYFNQAKGPRKAIVYNECLKGKSDQIAMLKSTLPSLQQKAISLSNQLHEEIEKERQLANVLENKKRELESQRSLYSNLQVKMKQNEEKLKADHERRMKDSETKMKVLMETNAREQANRYQSSLDVLEIEYNIKLDEQRAINNMNLQQIQSLQYTLANMPPPVVHVHRSGGGCAIM